MAGNGDLDIAKNARTIEWLKAELAGGISNLYKALVTGTEDAIEDALANIVITTYVLARRLGLDFSRVDERVRRKLEANVREDHEVESWFGDLSALLAYRERAAAVTDDEEVES